jgi:hypothetical protein
VPVLSHQRKNRTQQLSNERRSGTFSLHPAIIIVSFPLPFMSLNVNSNVLRSKTALNNVSFLPIVTSNGFSSEKTLSSSSNQCTNLQQTASSSIAVNATSSPS